MSRAVLMSIHPKWCELIASGKKTIEVRKTYPKEKTPFKVHIYRTFGSTVVTFLWNEGGRVYTSQSAEIVKDNPTAYPINCKVIGEFVCDGVYRVLDHPDAFAGHPLFHTKAIEDACLTNDEVEKYSGGKDVFGWHISDLVIYDQPKELSEFVGWRKTKFGYEPKEITRRPKSWCYVEELK